MTLICDCEHPKGLHIAGLNACRINGCSCPRFRDPGGQEQPEPGPRRVTVDVPDGYMLSISLVPYTEPAEETEPGSAEAADG